MPRMNTNASSTVASHTGSSDDDEENGALGESTQNSLFANYMDALSNEESSDVVFSQGLARVKEYLDWSQGGGNTSCLICLSQIKHTDAVWHCQNGCYAVLHISCAQEWARSQAETAAAKVAMRLSQFPAAAADARAKAEWGCPKCRQVYPISEIPDTYFCFCGKSANPEWDPWLVPHSCGELCSRRLPSGCSHSCLLLCHPGPCPPCPLVVDVSCHCGKVSRKRRCGHPEFGCGSICQRQLECGHMCVEECHDGECPPCQQVGNFRCACGSETSRLLCSERDFHCSKPCGRTLACGNHACKEVCHSGSCGGCPFEGVRTCPCGKLTYAELACTDEATPCGQTCGKLLSCGLHYCTDRCHRGDCSKTCRELVMKSCRCSKNEKEMLCGNEFTCERKCNNMRACGRHACKRRCCDGSCPPCEEACSRKLRCGNHKCPAPCHTALCRPCPLTVGVSCACGKVNKQLPCGTEATTGPPTCFSPCLVPPTCRHAGSKPLHRCHYGPCPACTAPCGSPLPGCQHSCASAKCHDPPPPPIPPFQRPKPPSALLLQQQQGPVTVGGDIGVGQANSKRAQARKGSVQDEIVPPAVAAAKEAQAAASSAMQRGGPPSDCPPCMIPCQTNCLGRHATVAVACSKLKPFSCDKPCGQPLSCGSHSCAMACHDVVTSCAPCTRSCDLPRSCKHPCKLPCHHGQCPPCDSPASLPCHCGKTTVKLLCHEVHSLSAPGGSGRAGGSGDHAGGCSGNASGGDPLCCQKPCHKQLPLCPHICKTPCHLGPCPSSETCLEEVSMRCECKRLKAKWECCKVQEALQAAGRARTYDMGMPLRLLPCDEGCRQAKATAVTAAAAASNTASSSAAAKAEASSRGYVVPPAAAAANGVELKDHTGGKQRLSRAEREALAVAEAEKRQSREARAKLIELVIKIGTWALVLLAGLFLALFAEKLLQWTS